VPRSLAFASLGLVLGLAVAGAPTATAAAMTPPQEPAAAAKALFQAWKQRSRKAAAKVAAPEAVEKLFGTRWQAMAFRGCTVREEEGGFECLFVEPRLDLSLAMIVDGGASVGGYNVSSVSFSSEE
jgi:hypothetical protein